MTASAAFVSLRDRRIDLARIFHRGQSARSLAAHRLDEAADEAQHDLGALS